MYFTQRNKKTAALLICLFVVLLVICSVFVSASEHQAHCHDEHCTLCLIINVIKGSAGIIGTAIILLTALGFSLCANPFVFVCRDSYKSGLDLFAHKVRMNN